MADDWDSDGVRTPQSYFDALNAKYNFAIDLFASKENAKCSHFFSTEQDAYSRAWHEAGGQWQFANPPYSRGCLPKFVTRAIAEAKVGAKIVALIPATTGTDWFNNRLLKCCDVLGGDRLTFGGVFGGFELSMSGNGYRQRILFVEGRVPFEPPVGFPTMRDWNPPATDSIILELRPPLR